MYLKALEIQGFKSFPDKIYLPFDEDITAVVGPNGSGKSNISDAIRWVVGEQSARMLRGGKMEDVIFGGTETRKQTSYAQVSLIMDNSTGMFPMEEVEVMVTRKYYRSSKKSEYFINKQPSLLQDVHSLFMGTGLGREGYAIIGQGRIDEILSVKSNQRREVFEEAAGISKFRFQKEESQRKLGRAEENMLRIQDKIAELELQVRPLEKQSETAKKFFSLRDQLRGLEISLWLEQLVGIREKQGTLEKDYNLALNEKNEASTTLQQLYEDIETLGQDMGRKSQEENQLRGDLTETEALVSEQEARITVLTNNISNNENNTKRLAESLEKKQERKEELGKQVQEQEEKTLELQEKRSSLGQEHEQKMAEVMDLGKALQQRTASLGELRQREQSETQSVGQAKAQLSALTSSTQEIFDQDEIIRREIASLESHYTEEQQQLETLELALQEAQEGKQSSQNSVEGYRLRVEGRATKLSTVKTQVETLSRNLHAGESKVKLLSDMENMYEGFSYAVKKVMTEAKRGALQNIHGPIAELIDVPKDFTTAIETALGSAMNHIVVDGFREVKQVQNFLKQQKNGGWVTVLPLDSMQAGYLSQKDQVEREAGFVGIGNNLVGYRNEYSNVVSNLLGRTVVMENIDCAYATQKKFNYKLRIVTLDGQVLNAGGSAKVGAAPRNANSTSVFSRKEELDQLKKQIAEQTEEIKTLQQEQETLQGSLSGEEYQLNIALGEVRTWEDKILQLQGQKELSNQKLSLVSEQMLSGKEKLNQLTDRSSQVETFTAEAQRQIAEQEARLQEIQATQAQAVEEEKSLREQWQEANAQGSALSAQLQSLDSEETAVLESKKVLASMLAEVCQELESSSHLIADYGSENQQYTSEISRMEEENHRKKAYCVDLRRRVGECHSERMLLEASRTQKEKDSREKNNHLLSLERSVTLLGENKANAEKEEIAVLDRLYDQYDLTHEAALAQKQELESIPATQKQISQLKSEISKLGTVNVNAIEEFERVNERYTYFIEQREDVLAAKKDLEKIIAEIVKEMEEIFSREFKKINETFGEVFVSLFGGGRAELILEEPEDVLGSGIEIKAQPPGKALKVISLLSGGEKAFIAVALYFAILKIRPTPFVVMDEIDAALDDGNVERLVGYLKTICGTTQFIIITHRRGSMEAADVLYGITMQEKGVSRMLRLSLNEVEQTLNMQLS